MTTNSSAKGWSHHTAEVIVTSAKLSFLLTEPTEALIIQNGVQTEQQKITYRIVSVYVCARSAEMKVSPEPHYMPVIIPKNQNK